MKKIGTNRVGTEVGLSAVFVIAVWLWVVSLSCAAQTPSHNKKMEIVGQVYDAYIGIPLKARIVLMDKDSVAIDTVEASVNNKTSVYRFVVPNETREYILRGELAGYDTAWVAVKARASRSGSMELVDNMYLRKKTKEKTYDLDEVQVTATRVQMVCRGDTIVYDASAFALPEGSLLSDLVRQLPGAELKSNGDIYVNGQKVDFLTLNGRDFFKRNNKALLDNLPYYTVRNVKVFHRDKDLQEQVTGGVGKDYVMDVSLKREYVNSALGNMEIGLGTEDRWMARAFGMLMGANSNMTVFGNMNNVNEDRRPGQQGDWTPANQTQGVKTTKQIGLNYATQDKAHESRENLSAMVEWGDYWLSAHSYQQLFAGNNIVEKYAENYNRNKSMKIDVTNNYQMFKKKTNGLFWKTHVAYSRNRASGGSADSTYYTSLLNRLRTDLLTHSHQLGMDTQLSYMRRLRNKDMLIASAMGGYDRLRPNDAFDRYMYAGGSGDSDGRYRYNDSRRHGYNYRMTLQYAYAITADWSLRPTIGYAHRYTDKDYLNYRLDQLDGMTIAGELGMLPSTGEALARVADADNSNRYTNHTDTYSGSVDLIWSQRKHFMVLSVPLDIVHDKACFYHKGDLTREGRRYGLLQPSLRYSRNGKNRVDINYRTQIAMPDYYQMIPFTDASSPTTVYVNNRNLRRRIENYLSAYRSSRIDSLRLGYWVSAEASYIYHAWGVRTHFDEATGVFTYTTDNVSKPNWKAMLKAGTTWEMDARRRFSLSADGYVGYTHSVDFMPTDAATDTELSNVNTTRLGLNASLQYRLRDFRVGIGGKVSGRYSHSNRQNFERINTYDFQYGGNMQCRIPGADVIVATDINMYSRCGYNSAAMNDNSLVWNVSLSRSLCKGKITAKILAFDVLHQLSNRQYYVNAQGYTETWYNSVPRYVMATLAVAINTKKKGR